MKIYLTNEERKKCRDHGIAIYKNKIANGNHVPLIDKTVSDAAMDVISVASEYAVHKFLDMEYKFELFDKTDNGDIIIKDLVGDIKCGKPYSNSLKVIPRVFNEKQQDIYIAINQDDLKSLYSFTLHGWLFGDEFKEKMREQKFHTVMYVVDYKDLTPPEQLILFKNI